MRIGGPRCSHETICCPPVVRTKTLPSGAPVAAFTTVPDNVLVGGGSCMASASSRSATIGNIVSLSKKPPGAPPNRELPLYRRHHQAMEVAAACGSAAACHLI